jgi:hypothetical protein
VLGISIRDDAMLAHVTLVPAKDLVTAANDTAILRITPAGTIPLIREGAALDLQDGRPVVLVKNIQTLLPAVGSPAHGRWHADDDSVARVTLADQRSALLRFAPDGTFTCLLATRESVPTISASTFWNSLSLPAVGTGNATVVKGVLKASTLPRCRGSGYREKTIPSSPLTAGALASASLPAKAMLRPV